MHFEAKLCPNCSRKPTFSSAASMSALGQKLTFCTAHTTSASGQERTNDHRPKSSFVRYCPKAEMKKIGVK